METHSTIVGGSTAARVLGCPGSVRLTATAPPEVPSEYAAEGTALHGVIADMVKAGSRDTNRYLGETVYGLEITEYHVDLLDKALTATRILVGATTERTMVEKRVALTPVPDAYGTADLVLVRTDSIVVCDYKFGAGVMVGVADNKQLMFYAAALFFTHPQLFYDEDGKARKIFLAIIQPTDRDDNVLKSGDPIEVDDIVAFTRQLIRALDRDDVTMGDHCRFCPATTICPTLKEAAERSLAITPDDMEPDAIKEALELAHRLSTWITQLNSYAHSFASRGHDIPGYKLVPKRAVRKWKDEDVASTQLTTLGLDPETQWKRTLVSPAQAEKALKQKLPDGLIRARSSGTVLVPESDSRKPVVGGPALLQALSDSLTALTIVK